MPPLLLQWGLRAFRTALIHGLTHSLVERYARRRARATIESGFSGVPPPLENDISRILYRMYASTQMYLTASGASSRDVCAGRLPYMPVKTVLRPTTATLPWLVRGDARRRHVGVACLLPDCRKVVPRTGGRGRQPWYCSEKHRAEARRRREGLLKDIARLEHTLAATPMKTAGVDRRALESDLRYLRGVLAAYPALSGSGT